MHPDRNQSHHEVLPLWITATIFLALALTIQASAQQTAAAQAPSTANAQVKIIRVSPKHVSPLSGEQMYAEYCSVCHGASARGDGPAASALRQKPSDLTALSAQNGGGFPRVHVMYVLTAIESPHVRSLMDMPSWALVFGSLRSPNHLDGRLRARNLTSYLETLRVSRAKDLAVANDPVPAR